MKAAWQRWRGLAAAVVLGIVVALMPVLPVSVTTMTVAEADYFVPAAFWASLLFPAVYTVLAPWWRNPVGRMLVWLDLLVAGSTFPAMLNSQFGVPLSSGLTKIGAASIGCIPLIILSRTWLLGRINGWQPRLPWRHPHSGEQPDG